MFRAYEPHRMIKIRPIFSLFIFIFLLAFAKNYQATTQEQRYDHRVSFAIS